VVLLAAVVLGFLVVKSRRDAHDGVRRKQIRRFSLRELGQATGGSLSPWGAAPTGRSSRGPWRAGRRWQ